MKSKQQRNELALQARLDSSKDIDGREGRGEGKGRGGGGNDPQRRAQVLSAL